MLNGKIWDKSLNFIIDLKYDLSIRDWQSYRKRSVVGYGYDHGIHLHSLPSHAFLHELFKNLNNMIIERYLSAYS